MNRDHWLLYLTSPNSQPLLPSDAPLVKPFAISQSLAITPPSPAVYQDSTLEILMSQLSHSSREQFFHVGPGTGHERGTSISSKIGIDRLFPASEMTLDSFGFDPCGYSANAVIGSGMPSSAPEKPGGGYFTVHVTPEQGWSYASFECNIPLAITSTSPTSRPDLTSLIRSVVGIFQPSRLSITLFVSTPASGSATASSEMERRAWEAFGSDLLEGGYERKDRIGYEFHGYYLVFACFENGSRMAEGQQAAGSQDERADRSRGCPDETHRAVGVAFIRKCAKFAGRIHTPIIQDGRHSLWSQATISDERSPDAAI